MFVVDKVMKQKKLCCCQIRTKVRLENTITYEKVDMFLLGMFDTV